MKVRSDIADMLRDGLTDTQVAHRAHVSRRTVAAARTVLDLPKSKRGRKRQPSLDQALLDRSVLVDGGHWEWTGPTWGGHPHLKFDSRRYTATHAAFIVRYGRAPVGVVRPGCDHEGCVAPDHVEDRPMREHNTRTYELIFGGAL